MAYSSITLFFEFPTRVKRGNEHVAIVFPSQAEYDAGVRGSVQFWGYRDGANKYDTASWEHDLSFVSYAGKHRMVSNRKSTEYDRAVGDRWVSIFGIVYHIKAADVQNTSGGGIYDLVQKDFVLVEEGGKVVAEQSSRQMMT